MYRKKAKELVSFEKCKKILNQNGSQYTDEEVIQIAEYIGYWADLTVETFLETKEQRKHAA